MNNSKNKNKSLIFNLVFPLILSDDYLSIFINAFLGSKIVTSMMIEFFQMTSPKAAYILFQALTALIVIQFFPYMLISNEGLNNLPIEEAAVL